MMQRAKSLLSSLLVTLCCVLAGRAQEAIPEKPKPQQAPMGGVSTGVAHAAQKDAQSRPITAGGFVDGAPVVFTDITKQAGLDKFRHRSGTAEKKSIIETPGSGVALIDYDNDGWLDIYLLNGSTFAALKGKEAAPRAMLLHNNHDGTFSDVTAKAGVSNERWGFGVAVGDYDNDGWPDIYVTNFGKNRLYHNNHDGTFTDVAEKAGVTLGNWSTGATWGDYDGDGRLDLFVPGYVHYDMANQPVSSNQGATLCQFRGEEVMCGPRGLKGEPDYLFHNKGDGTFEDASYASGYALNENGRETASMGIAFGDYRNNGLVDFYNTTFSDDYNPLYRNDGNANFTDVSYPMGFAEPTIPFLGWGTAFLDFDNDGWKDIVIANGHVYPSVDRTSWGTTWAQRPLLFRNIDGKKFDLMPAVEGSGLANVYVGRGVAVGDLFNNGKLDVVINVLDGHPALLRNVSPDTHHWLELKLVGGPKSPRDAVGATVYLTAGGLRQRGDVVSGGSYASTHDPRLHFGLGDATSIDMVEVRWPSGAKERFAISKTDQIVTLVEGKGTKL